MHTQNQIQNTLERGYRAAVQLMRQSQPIRSFADLKDFVMGAELHNAVRLYNDRPSELWQDCIDALARAERYSSDFQLMRDWVVHFHEMPLSVTAQFYVELLNITAEPPANLEVLLSKLAPQISDHAQQLVLEFEETFPPNLSWQAKKQFFRESPPVLRVMPNLAGLKHLPATLEAFSRCVVTEDYVIDVSDIHRLSFTRQVALYDLLRHEYPAVARALYQHNPDWQRLAGDIDMVRKAGLSPRAAIEALIKGLRRGGASISRSEVEAQPVADAAVERFLAYFHTLPASIRDALLELPSSPMQTFFSDLDHGSCVEVMASKLQSFLDKQSNVPTLDALPGIHPEVLKTIEGRCKRGLDPQKSADILPYTPVPLLKNYVESLYFESVAEVCWFLCVSPPGLIRAFFTFSNIEAAGMLFDIRLACLNNNRFSEEKIGVIMAAILLNPAISDRAACFRVLKVSLSRLKGFYHSMTPSEFITLCREDESFIFWLVAAPERIEWLMSTCLIDTLKQLFETMFASDETLLWFLMKNHREMFLLTLKLATPFVRDVLLSLPACRTGEPIKFRSVGFFSKEFTLKPKYEAVRWSRVNSVLIQAISKLGYDEMKSYIDAKKVRALIFEQHQYGKSILHDDLNVKEFVLCLHESERFSALIKSEFHLCPLLCAYHHGSLSMWLSLLSGCPFPDGKVYHINDGLKEAWTMLCHLSVYLRDHEKERLAGIVGCEIASKLRDVISHERLMDNDESFPGSRVEIIKIQDWLNGDEIRCMADLIVGLKQGFAQDKTRILKHALGDFIGELPDIPLQEPAPQPRLNR